MFCCCCWCFFFGGEGIYTVVEGCFGWVVLFNILTSVSSQRDFSHGKFGLLFCRKANCGRVALPNLQRMLGVLVYP